MLHPRALSAPNSATSSPSSVKNPPTPTRLHVPSPWYPIQHQSKSYHNDPETPTNSDNDPYPHICVCPYPAPKLLRSARVPIPKTRTWPNIPPPPSPLSRYGTDGFSKISSAKTLAPTYAHSTTKPNGLALDYPLSRPTQTLQPAPTASSLFDQLTPPLPNLKWSYSVTVYPISSSGQLPPLLDLIIYVDLMS